MEVDMGELHDLHLRLDPLRGRAKRGPSDALHAKILWSAWVHAEGGEDTIRDRYTLGRNAVESDLSIRSDEIHLYREGKRSFSPPRLKQLVRLHPSLECIANWPLRLLSPRKLSSKQLEHLINPYLLGSEYFPGYEFPGDRESKREPLRRCTSYRDLERLFERGDTYGFFATAEAYRGYHLEHRPDSQWFTARYMIRSLPGFCRHPFVRPHAEDAVSLVKHLLKLLPDTSFRIRIDDSMLWHQIDAEIHEPSHEIRTAARTDGRVIEEPADPVIHYKYVRCRPSEAPLFPSL